ncbi:hypothetical protein HG531_005927 [Fusarium graminearum]|nr:hypothetical protein HG531_005927 [Fusarium graminearum]
MAEVSLSEDGRAVERDDIDTAHLLGQHDSAGAVVGSSNSGDSETIPETLEVTSTSVLAKLLVVDNSPSNVADVLDDDIGTESKEDAFGIVNESLSLIIKKVDRFEALGITGNESGSAEKVGVLGHAIGLGKDACVGNSLLFRFVL